MDPPPLAQFVLMNDVVSLFLSNIKLIKPQILLQNQILHVILFKVTPLHHPGFLKGLVVILILRFLATFYISKSTTLHHRVYYIIALFPI
jgi:hypothetical protein